MKRFLLLFILFASFTHQVFSQTETLIKDSLVQKKDIKIESKDKKVALVVSGFVRNDIFYNSRQNAEAINGLFLIHPLPPELDANGEDINNSPQFAFLSLVSRIRLDLSAPNLGKAEASAAIECDFAGQLGGSKPAFGAIRLRQAYAKVKWEHHALLLGQTWHPFTTIEIAPLVAGTNTGAPYNPFNRSVQFRYEYFGKGLLFTAAVVNEANRLACIPNFYGGLTYSIKGFSIGAGYDFKTTKPKEFTLSPTDETKKYKTKEKFYSHSVFAFLEYKKDKFAVRAKGIYSENGSDKMMLGGYGVASVDEETGYETYTNFRTVSSFLNVSYGKKLVGSIFLGYSKNLGTTKSLVAAQGFGIGYYDNLGINQLIRISPCINYFLKNWRFTLEYDYSLAQYGEINQKNGKTDSGNFTVNNHNVMGVVTFFY